MTNLETSWKGESTGNNQKVPTEFLKVPTHTHIIVRNVNQGDGIFCPHNIINLLCI